MKQPESLKHFCFLILRSNDTIEATVKVFPTSYALLHEFSTYLSPYGLTLLEDATIFKANDYVWLSQWPIVKTYTLKLKNRLNNHYLSACEKNACGKEFFYDSLLNDMGEKVIQKQPVATCHWNACSYFMNYPIKYPDARHEFLPINSFIQMLSKHVKTLTVTMYLCTKLKENFGLFAPLLDGITLLKINMLIGPFDGVSVAEEILLYVRSKKLKSVKFIYNEYMAGEDKFIPVFQSIYKPLPDASSDSFSELDDLTEGEPKRLKVDFDLYDCALEPVDVTEKVCTCVERLELISVGLSPKLLLSFLSNALLQWNSLTSLAIHKVDIHSVDKLGLSLNRLAEFGGLKKLELDGTVSSVSLENAVLNLCKATCTIHHKKRNVLERLVWDDPPLSSEYIKSILQDNIICDVNSSECQIKSLKSLSLCLYEKVEGCCFESNSSLQELYVQKCYHEESEEEILKFAENHPALVALEICPVFPGSIQPSTTLCKVMRKTNMKLISFQQCFNCGRCPFMVNESFSSSSLTTLVWKANGMDDNGLKDFSLLLANRANFPRLKILDISDNRFTTASLPCFLNSLKQGKRFFHRLAVYNRGMAKKEIYNNGLRQALLEYTYMLDMSVTLSDTSDYISQM